MITPLVFSLILSLVGLVAIIAEFFIPSAGLIGFGGLGAIITAVVLVFRDSGSLYGFIFLFANLVIVPVVIIAYWKHFPRSFMGRRLILSSGTGKEDIMEKNGLEHINVGGEGVSLTALHPAGTAVFGEKRVSVQTDGEFLDKNCPVRIIRIEGNRVLVELADPVKYTPDKQKEQQT
ncbi:NfeD family protein [Marispirochaeta sp.]|uniref:NfeD family protein n=1 Tax=Marispirochaeta sp. TaxID=2038653 RepID=UPI0029C86411|nr:NfeD family protein [Marispirochaeta sp.]